MKKVIGEVYKKAEEVLFNDKINSSKLSDIVSSEIYYCLKQYFDIAKDSYLAKIFTDRSGEINISFSFRAKRVLFKRINNEQL